MAKPRDAVIFQITRGNECHEDTLNQPKIGAGESAICLTSIQFQTSFPIQSTFPLQSLQHFLRKMNGVPDLLISAGQRVHFKISPERREMVRDAIPEAKVTGIMPLLELEANGDIILTALAEIEDDTGSKGSIDIDLIDKIIKRN